MSPCSKLEDCDCIHFLPFRVVRQVTVFQLLSCLKDLYLIGYYVIRIPK